MERVEALDLCAKCGGYCCSNFPGKFSPDDLAPSGSLTEQAINDALDTGLAVVYTSFTNVEGSKVAPIFTLAARGVERPPLSLCHDATRCAHLEGDRCKFPLESRPYECAMMVPAESVSCCGIPDDLLIEPLWVDYQELLREVIEKRSGRPWCQELISQAQARRNTDGYAYGAWSLITSIGITDSSTEADAVIAKWLKSLA